MIIFNGCADVFFLCRALLFKFMAVMFFGCSQVILVAVVGTFSPVMAQADGGNVLELKRASVNSDPIKIFGEWEAGDLATESIYGSISIGPKKIVWKNKKNGRCIVFYRRIKEADGTVFRDQSGFHYVTTSGDGRYSTFLLKIEKKKCAEDAKRLRFTLDSENPGYLAYGFYRADEQSTIGLGHFFAKRAN